MARIILYHGSSKKIRKFKPGRPIWFTSQIADTYRYIEVQGWTNKGYVYKVEVEVFETTSDWMLFHTGKIFKKHKKADVFKMESKDMDNNWYVIKDITKFSVQLHQEPGN